MYAMSNTTDPSALASPAGAAPSESCTPLTTVAGARTGWPVVFAVAHGGTSSPETVELTIDGVTTIVDVGCDRDDWEVPDVAAGHEHRVLWAIDNAVEEYVAANDDHEGRERATHRYRSRRAA